MWTISVQLSWLSIGRQTERIVYTEEKIEIKKKRLKKETVGTIYIRWRKKNKLVQFRVVSRSNKDINSSGNEYSNKWTYELKRMQWRKKSIIAIEKAVAIFRLLVF